LNDQIVYLHAGKGVRTPPVAKKSLRIITANDYDAIHRALPDNAMRLLVETDIESGLRWGELTELRPSDLDIRSGMLTVARTVIELTARNRPDSHDTALNALDVIRDTRQTDTLSSPQSNQPDPAMTEVTALRSLVTDLTKLVETLNPSP
jgi:integrase